MMTRNSRFALFFGNRGFFPASLQASARAELPDVLNNLGHETLMLEADATRYGAVETPEEGEIYRKFLEAHRGEYDGVILCLPNFGDETGAVAALKDAGVPILVQAYPDEMDKMAPEVRRDAFCGKFSIMDVFCQYGLPFTALQPHVVHPGSDRFARNIAAFDGICRVVGGMKDLVVGAVGARTTAFKTVRIDELALQKHGITVETFDLSDLFARIRSLSDDEAEVKAKRERLSSYTNWTGAPDEALLTLSKMGVALDHLIAENHLDCLSIRCWIEMQEQLGVSPCVLLSELNDRGIATACELDTGNAVTMHTLACASGNVATLLDWNNNYEEEEDKCILFHCGPVPQTMMTAKGQIVDHAILKNAVGEGCAYGCNVGRIAPTPFTYGSLLTEDGKLKFYLGEGRFTDDPIPDEFFGCAGVAEIELLQDVLQEIGYMGFRHHVSVTPGEVVDPVQEAFERYLGYEVVVML
jgi:L-fucose isomerase-like protein